MKLNSLKKKILFLTLAASAFVSFSIISVSCAKKFENENFYKEQINSLQKNIGTKLSEEVTVKKYKDGDATQIVEEKIQYWQRFNYVEGIVSRVYDGDTYDIEYEQGGVKKTTRIRSWGIDTPETRSEHVPNVTEIEQKYSDMDTKHAKELILNKKVRTVFLNSSSYDRELGISFFGENFEECFEFRMLRDGYTLPRVVQSNILSWQIDFKKDTKDLITSLLLQDFAYAANYAVLNRLGFYKDFKTPEELQKNVYLSHGDVVTKFMFLPSLLTNSEVLEPEDNMFLFMEQQKNNK